MRGGVRPRVPGRSSSSSRDLFYNLACLESLTGHEAEAVEHLRKSIELSEQFRAYARQDSDLDAIRDDPAVKELLAADSEEARSAPREPASP
jgi:hypothetical protein